MRSGPGVPDGIVAHVSSTLPPVDQKPSYVAAMFGRIAPRYDLMNTLMTGGLDRAWRAKVVETALASPRRTVGRWCWTSARAPASC